jgi:parvulin-like peptidyl-prolyl isomerase
MKRTLLFLLLTFSSSALVIGIGCGKSTNDPIVAKVGDDEITVSVVNNFFDKMGVTFTSAEEEFRAKRDALDSLIDYKLMIKGAYAANLDKDTEVDQLVNSEKSNFMFDELYRQEILPKVSVSDKEVEEFYDRLKVEYHLTHILVSTQKEADSIAAEIKKGADFGGIARAISLDQSSAVRGGDLDFISWGMQVDPEFRDAAFKLSVGQTSDPVKTSYGWHIIRLLETREAQQLGDKAQLLPAIRDLLKSRKSSEVEAAFLKQIEERAQVEINTEATQMLMDRLDQFYPKTLGSAARPDNFFPQTELLKPFELQMVLASYQGGEVTVEDYLKKIANVAEAYRPRFNDSDSLKKVIFRLELRNIMEYEAGQRNVEQETEYQKRIMDFREGLMADRFVRTTLGRNIEVDEDEIREYYNSHLEDFMTPRELHLQEIEVDSSQQAVRIGEQLSAGADFGALAAKYTVRSGFKEKKGDLGLVQPGRFPALYEVARLLVKGQVSDTIRNDDGKYSIVKLIDTKESAAAPVESIVGQVKQKIMTLKRSTATADWLKEERSKTGITVYDDVLRKAVDKAKYEKK